ncbi:hypothetical protein IEQ34_015870 [Dendrobium chrysotoxum]|uniref:RRM domain-containing protein n=1 Tax=Dendrobium chrysotoxum TaxID=161865 RepID=A0AAV7GK41_DENCH|nr:hypothetical protein IEQ34_015870 [Dendrobium chrysotoxum]
MAGKLIFSMDKNLIVEGITSRNFIQFEIQFQDFKLSVDGEEMINLSVRIQRDAPLVEITLGLGVDSPISEMEVDVTPLPIVLSTHVEKNQNLITTGELPSQFEIESSSSIPVASKNKRKNYLRRVRKKAVKARKTAEAKALKHVNSKANKKFVAHSTYPFPSENYFHPSLVAQRREVVETRARSPIHLLNYYMARINQASTEQTPAQGPRPPVEGYDPSTLLEDIRSCFYTCPTASAREEEDLRLNPAVKQPLKMSRICVKNLPMYVKEDRLREFFSQKGEVTDAKLMRTTDGKSRQFGFVGFRTEREAEEALKFFDNTYMDTSRITCEIARRVGDPNTPRPWSRYSVKKNNLLKENSKESSKNSPLTTSKGQRSSSARVKNLGSSENSDPKLREFLQIMQPRSKAKLWTNDTIHSMDFSEQKSPEKETHQGKIKKSSLLQAQLSDESDLADKSSPRSLIKGSKKSPTDKSPQVAKDDVISDMDYLKSRIKKNWSDSEADDSFDEDADRGSGNDHNDGNSHMDVKDQIVKYEDSHEHAINAQLDEENIDEENCDVDNVDRENPMTTYNDERSLALETGRLFVRNLPYTTNEDELRDLFSQFGDVSEVHLVADKDTKRSKGIGYLLYTLPESATRALEALDNSIFQGRLLHVMAAKPQNRANGKLGSETTTANDKKNLKQQREEQKKASEASGDTRAWNSLFMRQDTLPFFDINLEIDRTVEDYVERIIFSLAAAIDEQPSPA